jgi:hypothetical protein
MRSIKVLWFAGLLMIAGGAQPGATRDMPYCATFRAFAPGTPVCTFRTWQQCMASVSGTGGTCRRNTQYRGNTPSTAPGRARQPLLRSN